jgi:hypothetical protein
MQGRYQTTLFEDKTITTSAAMGYQRESTAWAIGVSGRIG